MKRFKNILAVYDNNEGAEDVLDQAIMLAQTNQARLTIIDVVEPDRQSENNLRERKRRLERLIPAIKSDSTVKNVETRVLVGTPFLEIVREVLHEHHDLVIASAEGGSIVRNVFFGSTATHLVRKCPCPVWILKPGQEIPYVRVLAAIDPKMHDSTSASLNIKVMDLSTSLARMSSAELDIVHAWDVTGNDRDTLASEAPARTHKAILEKHETQHRAALDALLQDYSLSDIKHEKVLTRGIPQRVISDLVNGRQVDVIVMGTVTRTGIPGLLTGNAAETILSSVSCGVLAVKPDGFVTPVTLA
jgi:universal stress protein E